VFLRVFAGADAARKVCKLSLWTIWRRLKHGKHLHDFQF
jgi:hypothetical protein